MYFYTDLEEKKFLIKIPQGRQFTTVLSYPLDFRKYFIGEAVHNSLELPLRLPRIF